MRLDSPGFLRLNLPAARLFSVSDSGELAIGIGQGFSTLARVPLSGGGPREVLEDVLSVGWAPGGESLAAAVGSSQGFRLEFPLGRSIYSTKGMIRSVRVSPDGQRVAFIDHPLSWDERGSIAVVDRSGKKTTLTKEFPSMNAVAWSPRGDEVWYSAPDDSFRAVSLSGRERVVMRTAGGGGIEDVAHDGRALLSLYSCRSAIMGVFPGETREHDLSWLDGSTARDLSADGRTLLFFESGKGASSPYYDTYVRKLDGSDPIRLGVGDPRALSPDGKWAAVVVNTVPPRLELLPTGAGDKRVMERADVAEYRFLGWFPDGGRIYFDAILANGRHRVYSQAASGGLPQALAEEDVFAARAVSPDGRYLAVRKPDQSWQLLDVVDRRFLPLPALQPADRPIRFAADGKSIFVETRNGDVLDVYRVGVPAGRRELYRSIAPSDPVGIELLGEVRMSADGGSYVYTYSRCLSDLYLVEGLR
jgi:Tol biopolymer transport system component